MATDIQDWTTAVNITGGSVAIAGTATVTIVGTTNVAITGQPTVILGAGTASVGSISAIGSTVTVAGTINIGNVPAVTISGTPTVNINSGTVSISGTPVINIQSANGVTIYGPNLLARSMAGPITGGWTNARAFNCSITFNADGTMTLTLNLQPVGAFVDEPFLTGAYANAPCLPGEQFYLEASFKTLDHTNSVRVAIAFLDGAGNEIGTTSGTPVASPIGTFVTYSVQATAPPGGYRVFARLYPEVTGGVNGDRVVIGHVRLANLGAFPINAQQGSLPATIKVNVVDSEAVSIPLVGAQAFIDFAAVAGRSYVVQIATGTMAQATGGAWTNIFGVYDGLNTLNANCLWGTLASITATAQDKDRVHATDLGIIVPVGHATRIGFSSTNVGISEMAAAGVYLQ